MTKRDHREYVRYYFEHPEKFQDSPPKGVSSVMWVKKIQEGEATLDDVDKMAERLREQWKSYHHKKAEALGFKIDLERLENDMNWLAIENRLAADMV